MDRCCAACAKYRLSLCSNAMAAAFLFLVGKCSKSARCLYVKKRLSICGIYVVLKRWTLAVLNFAFSEVHSAGKKKNVWSVW